MLLSIGMMVKNESKYLRKCLESLQPIRDAIDSELVIVDTGSTDNTVEIAKEFTGKVYFHEWHNDFSEIRNIVNDYCSGEWIFIIDGDEILEKSQYIINFFKDQEYKKWNSVCIVAKNFTSSEYNRDYSLILAPRLFKNDGYFHFEGAIHNQPKYKNPLLAIETQLLHYGYISDDKELMERKFNRTSAILKEELNKNPDNIYYLYQLSVSYSMHGDLEESLEKIVKAYNIIKRDKLDEEKYKYVYISLAQMYIRNHKFEEAEKICLEALEGDSIYIDLYYYIATAQSFLNKNELAIKNYEIYLNKVKNYGVNQMANNISIIHNTLGRYEDAYENLSTLYYRIGNVEKAIEYINMIESENTLNDVMINVINIFVNGKKIIDLKHFYENKILNNHKHLEDNFLIILESQVCKLNDKEKEEIYKAFSENSSDYALLNKFRLQHKEDRVDETILKKILLLDFNKLPLFYGDVIYLMMVKKQSVEELFDTISDRKLEIFLKYLNDMHNNLGEIIYEYLNINRSNDYSLNEVFHKRILEEYALKSNNLKGEHYKDIFHKYLKDGFEYIKKVYNTDVIENGELQRLKSDEDCFLLILYSAEKNRNDRLQYVRNLRKALAICNYMKNGIELLLGEFNNRINNENHEFGILKNKLKINISNMIQDHKLEEARLLIKEYENIVKDDIEIVLFKSQIALKEDTTNY